MPRSSDGLRGRGVKVLSLFFIDRVANYRDYDNARRPVKGKFAGSTLSSWDVSQDCITEHDRRHALLRDYTVRSNANDREVARAIRPLIEAFFRVAFPEYFPPGTLLGPFRNVCEQRVGTPQQILDQQDTQELC